MLRFERFTHRNGNAPFNVRHIIQCEVTGYVVEDILSVDDIDFLFNILNRTSENFIADLNYGNGYSVPYLFGSVYRSKPKEEVQRYFNTIIPFLNAADEAGNTDVTRWIVNKIYMYFKPFELRPLQGFLPYSFRVVLPGKGGLYLHQDGKLLPYIHEEVGNLIGQHILPDTMLSWYFTLRNPSKGGELWVADSIYDNCIKEGQFTIKDPNGNIIAEEAMKHEVVETPAGSLLMFKGGTYWHKVIPPAAHDTERVTLGGFAALSTDEKSIYFWS
ncbi:MAG: hypothetical protein NZM35_00560 [Chitinophagales bacterium]|nr:hypothetical protein [Chitinophagales bacterium]MDW8417809.1 hypothetical protein [Chitinophagales bacterium]